MITPTHPHSSNQTTNKSGQVSLTLLNKSHQFHLPGKYQSRVEIENDDSCVRGLHILIDRKKWKERNGGTNLVEREWKKYKVKIKDLRKTNLGN